MSGSNSVSNDLLVFDEEMRTNTLEIRQTKKEIEDLKQDLSSISSRYSYEIDEYFKDSLSQITEMMNELVETEK
jgi:hypothetical protein